MPTLVTPRRNRARRGGGVTLLELLVVLAIVGLVVAVAAPRMIQVSESLSAAGERRDVINRIGALGYRARQQGEGFVLERLPANDGEVPLSLPRGWTLQASEPVTWRANGVCLGGRLQLRKGDWQGTLVLEPPLCEPRVR